MPNPNTECEVCGEEFYKRPNRKESTDHHFCSSECYGKWREGNIEGENHPQYQSESVECDNCGDAVNVQPWKIEKNEHHFCSHECYGEWRDGKFSGEDHWQWEEDVVYEYGGDWGTQRRKALKRDNHECQRCGKSKEEIGRNPDVHHKKAYRTFEEPKEANKLENLICLCRECHQVVEGGNSPGEAALDGGEVQ